MTFDLSHLDSEEFADEMQESMFDEEMWAPFIAGDIADRTRIALTAMAGHIQSQLMTREDDGDRDWRRRASNLLRKVHSRLTETNVAIRERNKQQSASVEANSRRWSALAIQLAEVLSESDMAFMLDEIPAGNTTAREWLDKRRAFAAAKNERQTA